MKLLLDANLSWKLIKKLEPFFDAVFHSKDIDATQPATDSVIWEFSKQNGYTIVSKDDDFEKLAILKKSPPKVIFLKVYNANTSAVAEILINNRPEIEAFCKSDTNHILEIFSI